ncbi:MAG: hypothetical protein DME21_10685 [Verrucomicrobia bacterium]|nr:MAG: hypothetical protein DME21_10685 [Verrucomicrobiota bacterium]
MTLGGCPSSKWHFHCVTTQIALAFVFKSQHTTIAMSSKDRSPDTATRYVLITPARNEVAHIGITIESVVSQTVRPLRWVICVNDSTDGTEAIAQLHAQSHSFITVAGLTIGGRRSFKNKAVAVAKGFEILAALAFDFVGVLDADISVGAHYFEQILAKFGSQPRLGLAAGRHVEWHRNRSRRVLSQPEDIAVGGNQFFRRACFSQIRGYRPLSWGGVDTLAGIMARMHGWETQTFPDIEYSHRREMGTEGVANILQTRWLNGVRDQKLGMDPFFAVLKAVRRLLESPLILGNSAWLLGYVCGYALTDDLEVPVVCRKFHRAEQMQRLRRLF